MSTQRHKTISSIFESIFVWSSLAFFGCAELVSTFIGRGPDATFRSLPSYSQREIAFLAQCEKAVHLDDIPSNLMVGSKGAYASESFSGTLGEGVLRRFNTVYINPAVTDVLGYTQKEMTGGAVPVIHPEDLERRNANLRELRRNAGASREMIAFVARLWTRQASMVFL